MKIAIVAPRLTAVVARTTSWEEFPALWRELLDEVYAFVRPRPELSPTPGSGHRWQNVMLYKDAAPAVEVGVLVGGPFTPAGGVVPSRLPGGTVATTVHRGDYATLGRGHDAVQRFAREQGLTLAGSRWEIYGHGDADPETEISYLLA